MRRLAKPRFQRDSPVVARLQVFTLLGIGACTTTIVEGSGSYVASSTGGTSSTSDPNITSSTIEPPGGTTTIVVSTSASSVEGTESSTTTSSTTSAEESGSSGLVASCGNGIVDDGEECDDGATDDGDGCTAACVKEWRRIFVTSQVYTGDFGGIDAADTICQSAAMSAGLQGTYRAWLSTNNESPEQRFIHSSVPYLLVDDTLIAADWDDLVDGELAHPIVLSELGTVPAPGTHPCTPVGVRVVWTGTTAQGTLLPDTTCTDWTGQGQANWGRIDDINASWTAYCILPCAGAEAAFYCVEQ